MEKITITFDKHSKVVNTKCLNMLTEKSIEKQLEFSARNGSVCNIRPTDELEPGSALYSCVYRDLLKKKQMFMKKEQQLTPSLVLYSILSTANKRRLCVSKEPNAENDFKIAKLKEI